MLYFAYGSNLSIQNRIKNKINIIKVKNYKLKGYKICFRDPYGDPDLEKSSKSFVPGVLYKFNSIEGEWIKSPGMELFNSISGKFDLSRIIVEDLHIFFL